VKPILAVILGVGALAAGGAVAYAAISSRKVMLNHGGVYTWVDTRGFGAAETKAQYEQLGFASVAVIETTGGWGFQGVWSLNDTELDTPDGMTEPVFHGYA